MLLLLLVQGGPRGKLYPLKVPLHTVYKCYSVVVVLCVCVCVCVCVFLWSYMHILYIGCCIVRSNCIATVGVVRCCTLCI